MPLAKTGSRAKFRHKRIASPKAFDPRSFRTKKVGKSRVIIGCPKGKYSPSTGRCKVGTKAQAVLRPKRNAFIDGVVPVTRLTNGKTVLAKPNGKDAKVFANKSQALNASIKLGIAFGIKSEVYQSPTSRRFYVVVKNKANPLGRKRNPLGTRKPEKQMTRRQMWEYLLPYAYSFFEKVPTAQAKYMKIRKTWPEIPPDLVLKFIKIHTRASNPRKKWYYGPSITHRGKVLVFPSAKAPTKATHGRKVKYAVGPFKTPDEASKKARYAKMGMTGR